MSEEERGERNTSRYYSEGGAYVSLESVGDVRDITVWHSCQRDPPYRWATIEEPFLADYVKSTL